MFCISDVRSEFYSMFIILSVLTHVLFHCCYLFICCICLCVCVTLLCFVVFGILVMCANKTKVLRVFDEQHNEEKCVKLRGIWAASLVSTGDYINVIGDFNYQQRNVHADIHIHAHTHTLHNVMQTQHTPHTPHTPAEQDAECREYQYVCECVIDNDKNYLIVHPDHLISGTLVGQTFPCLRKAVLSTKFAVYIYCDPYMCHIVFDI